MSSEIFLRTFSKIKNSPVSDYRQRMRTGLSGSEQPPAGRKEFKKIIKEYEGLSLPCANLRNSQRAGPRAALYSSDGGLAFSGSGGKYGFAG
jgi:hypothetical protein